MIDERGCYVYFDRLVPAEDEAQEESKDKKKAPAKAAPKKAKQDQNQEEAKPTHCRGWLDLTGMMHPGVKSITQRVQICQIDPKEANYPQTKPLSDVQTTAIGAATSSMDQLTVDQASKDESVLEDPFEATQTYVYITLDLSEPLYPVPDSNIIKDSGTSLLAKFGASPEFPSSLDAVKDFDDTVLFVVN